MQHAQRLAGRRDQVDGGRHPPDVLELEVGRVGQVDMGLRRAVEQQGPGGPPVRVRHQLDQAGCPRRQSACGARVSRHGTKYAVAPVRVNAGRKPSYRAAPAFTLAGLTRPTGDGRAEESGGAHQQRAGRDHRRQMRPAGPPPPAEMAAILAAVAQRHAGPPLKIRRHESDEGPAFWRWDCGQCGEYGGGRHHPDASHAGPAALHRAPGAQVVVAAAGPMPGAGDRHGAGAPDAVRGGRRPAAPAVVDLNGGGGTGLAGRCRRRRCAPAPRRRPCRSATSTCGRCAGRPRRRPSPGAWSTCLSCLSAKSFALSRKLIAPVATFRPPSSAPRRSAASADPRRSPPG